MSLPRAPLAVIFDMDGLLCDTETVYRDAMIAVAAERGHEMPVALFKSMIGLPGPASDRKVLEHFGEDFPIEAFNAGVEVLVAAACARGIALKAGVVELLDHLDRLALPRAIATSSSHRSVQAHLGQSGILPRFHAIIARGDYDNGKPSPDPFLKAAKGVRGSFMAWPLTRSGHLPKSSPASLCYKLVAMIALEIEQGRQVCMINLGIGPGGHHRLRPVGNAQTRSLNHRQIIGPVANRQCGIKADPKPGCLLLQSLKFGLAPQDRRPDQAGQHASGLPQFIGPVGGKSGGGHHPAGEKREPA